MLGGQWLQGCKTACGALFSVLGPPRSLENIEALYTAQSASAGAAAAHQASDAPRTLLLCCKLVMLMPVCCSECSQQGAHTAVTLGLQDRLCFASNRLLAPRLVVCKANQTWRRQHCCHQAASNSSACCFAGGSAAASEACWPADFPWRLAETALAFLATLGEVGQHGRLWLQAACPCLHQAMTVSPAHSRPLR